MSARVKCSFSIEHILNVAGSPPSKTKCDTLYPTNFDWLSCTRYRPPRVSRPKKKEGVQRRNPGRNPRIPFSPAQVALLEAKYQQTAYLSSHEVQLLATSLQLSEIRVKIWFQNRRARERREQEGTKKDNESKEDCTARENNATQDVMSTLIPISSNIPSYSDHGEAKFMRNLTSPQSLTIKPQPSSCYPYLAQFGDFNLKFRNTALTFKK